MARVTLALIQDMRQKRDQLLVCLRGQLEELRALEYTIKSKAG
jgi:hypothetical protein